MTCDHDLIIDGGTIRTCKKAASRMFRGTSGHTRCQPQDIPWRRRRLVIGTAADSPLPVMQQVRGEARRRRVGLVVLPAAEPIAVQARAAPDTSAILHLTW